MTDIIQNPTNPEDGIGKRIKDKRKELKLSVEGLANMTVLYDKSSDGMGVSPPTIYRYESDKSKPSAREIRLLSLALNVSPCWLINGEEWNQDNQRNTDIANAVTALFGLMERTNFGYTSNYERDIKHRANLTEILINDNLYDGTSTET